MEMHQIRYFLATCETANFTKAAAKCYVSQPALTKAIRALEEELGGELFDRRERPMKLTSLGRSVQARFGQLWGLKNEIKDLARHMTQESDSVFHLGILDDLAPDEIMGLCDALRRDLKEVRVVLHVKNQAELETGLKNGRYALAILEQGSINANTNNYTFLRKEAICLAMSKDHALADMEEIHWKDLAGCLIVNRSHQQSYGLPDGDDLGVTLHMSSDQDLHTLASLRTGRVLAFMPQSFKSDGIVMRNLANENPTRTLILADGRHNNEETHQLVRGAICNLMG